MQWIDDFIARKHGQKKIEYPHAAMKPALENTYGIMVYQEQVMQISKEVCGFTGGQADTLRKAVGKKKPEVMAKMKNDFIEGAIKTVGAERNLMERFWKSLEAFAAYCFPKAHSSCYATIAYWTAYLKANYPAAFMAALMTSDYDDTDRLAIEINECKHVGIEVLPPDVTESFLEFAVVPGKKQVRFGMAAIKNVGRGAVEEILRAREVDGSFNGIEDFFGKVSPRIVNRKTIESLIKAGAFDRFVERTILVANIDVLLAYANRIHKDIDSGQTDLFGVADDMAGHSRPQLKLEAGNDTIPLREQLQWERDLLGVYLSQHPLEAYKTFLEEKTVPIGTLKPEHHNKSVNIGGNIVDVREITTKNGQRMAFVKISDGQNEIEAVLFPSIHQQTLGMWEKDHVVIIKGKVSSQDRAGNSTGEVKVLVDDAREITHDQAQAYESTGKKPKTPKASKTRQVKVPHEAAKQPVDQQPARVYLRLSDSKNSDLLLSLKEAIDHHKGDREVVLVLGPEKEKQVIKLPMRLDVTDDSLKKLTELVGADNIKFQ